MKKQGKTDLDTDTEGVFGFLNSHIHYAIPYAAGSKIIEPWHSNIRKFERTLPGWCGKDNKERPEKLAHEIEARQLMSLEEFSRLFATWIEEYNNRIRSGLEEKTPNEMYEDVVKKSPQTRLRPTLDEAQTPESPSPGHHRFSPAYHYDRDLNPYIGGWITARYDSADIGHRSMFFIKRLYRHREKADAYGLF